MKKPFSIEYRKKGEKKAFSWMVLDRFATEEARDKLFARVVNESTWYEYRKAQ